MISSKYETLSMEALRADLLRCEANIVSQKEEILRTETFIVTFKDCLRQQHEALNAYILDRYKLKEERKNRKIFNSSLQEDSSISEISANDVKRHNYKKETLNTTFDNNSVSEFSIAHSEDTSTKEEYILRNGSKRNLSKDVKNELETKKFCSDKLSVKEEKIDKVKNGSMTSGSIHESESSIITPRRKLDQFDYNSVNVHDIIGFRHVIYICGSKGMLHMINGKETTVFNTQTQEDITQMTLFKYGRNNTLSLIVFTRSRLILFIDILKTQVPEFKTISVQGKIYVGKEVIYMPLVGGHLKKLIKQDCYVSNHIEHSHGNIRFFVPCYGVNKKRALISLEDRKLYKTLENDFDILETIDGIKNVKSLFRIGQAKYVCSSKRKLWVLDSEPSIIDSMKLSEDIKYIKGSKGFVVMVSESNTLLVFAIKENEDAIKKIQEQKFECVITGLSVESSKIHLMMKGEIVTLKIKA